MGSHVVATVVLLCPVLLACYPCQQITAGDLCGDHKVTMTANKIGWYPTLPAIVDGVPFNLLVDTGAGGTFLSATRSGKEQNDLGRDVSVTIGGMQLRLMFAWYVDSPFSSPEDGNINGILGDDLLFDLDYQQTQSEITLSDHPLVCDGPVIQAANPQGTKILLPPMMIDQELVVDALLDTGAALFLLSDKTAKALPDYVRDTAQPSGYCVFDGCYDSGAFITTLGMVCLGDVCEALVPAKYPGWDAVGQSWLQRHKSFIVSIYRRTLQICQ